MIVGITNAGNDTLKSLMMAAIIIAVLVGVAGPALSQLPWWQSVLAIVASLVVGPLTVFAVLAVIANAIAIPFVLRGRMRKKRFAALEAADLSAEDAERQARSIRRAKEEQ